jgi:hypothetical protein
VGAAAAAHDQGQVQSHAVASFYESPAALHTRSWYHDVSVGYYMSLLKKSRRYTHLSAADRLQSSRFMYYCQLAVLFV